MTREETIYTLEQMKTWSKDLSDDEIEALVMAIKALEQTDVLDEIRAEIEEQPYVSKMEVLDIIDEYRKEDINNMYRDKRGGTLT